MMDVLQMYCVIAFMMASTCYAQLCSSCGAKLNRISFPIPQAMSLRDFEYYYGSDGTQMSELYYVYQNPKPFEPYYNYRINYTAVSDGIFQESIVADELGLVGNVKPACIRVQTTLTPVIMDVYKQELTRTANFLRSTSSEMQTFWSSCPSKYVWTLKCRDWRRWQRSCPLDKVALGLSVPKVGQNAPDNIPWTPILRDLQQAKMVFGAEELYWAYTYGKSTLCT